MKYLKAQNIKVKGARPHYQKGQLGYGSRAIRRTEMEHKRELETIEKMVSLRKQGFSYHKIADVLNAMKVPTKTRKAKWHATTVMKILNG